MFYDLIVLLSPREPGKRSFWHFNLPKYWRLRFPIFIFKEYDMIKLVLENNIILFVFEDVLPVDTPEHHMIDTSTAFFSWFASHNTNLFKFNDAKIAKDSESIKNF